MSETMNKIGKLMFVRYKLHNIEYKKKIHTYTIGMLLSLLNKLKITDNPITIGNLSEFVDQHDEEIVKSIGVIFWEHLAMSDCRSISSTKMIKLSFSNGKIIEIPKKLMFQSMWYIENIIELEKAPDNITIPIDITDNALQQLIDMLNGDHMDNDPLCKTIEDAYTFIKCFDFLGLQYS